MRPRRVAGLGEADAHGDLGGFQGGEIRGDRQEIEARALEHPSLQAATERRPVVSRAWSRAAAGRPCPRARPGRPRPWPFCNLRQLRRRCRAGGTRLRDPRQHAAGVDREILLAEELVGGGDGGEARRRRGVRAADRQHVAARPEQRGPPGRATQHGVEPVPDVAAPRRVAHGHLDILDGPADPPAGGQAEYDEIGDRGGASPKLEAKRWRERRRLLALGHRKREWRQRGPFAYGVHRRLYALAIAAGSEGAGPLAASMRR